MLTALFDIRFKVICDPPYCLQLKCEIILKESRKQRNHRLINPKSNVLKTDMNEASKDLLPKSLSGSALKKPVNYLIM